MHKTFVYDTSSKLHRLHEIIYCMDLLPVPFPLLPKRGEEKKEEEEEEKEEEKEEKETGTSNQFAKYYLIAYRCIN